MSSKSHEMDTFWIQMDTIWQYSYAMIEPSNKGVRMMKNQMKKYMILGVSALSILSMTACASESQGVKEPEVTIVEDSDEIIVPDIAVESIDKIPDLEAISWIDDTHLLVLKENKSLYEGLDFHVSDILQNLYAYDVVSGQERLLGTRDQSQAMAIISPDKQYIFTVNYMPVPEGQRLSATGIIMTIDGTEITRIEDQALWNMREGFWSSDNEIMFVTDEGLMAYGTDGSHEKVMALVEGQSIGQIGKSGQMIYYTVQEDKSLWQYNIATQKAQKIFDNSPEFVMSPDGQSMVMIQVDLDQSTNTLVLYRFDDQSTSELAKGNFIYGISWVVDSSRIAYMENDSEKGLYVMLMDSQESYLVGQNYFGQETPSWSPNGQALMVSVQGVNEEGNLKLETHIIHLK